MEGFPDVPTAPATPVKGLIPSSAVMGSGDYLFDNFVHHQVTPPRHSTFLVCKTVTSSRKSRPLRLASPPPQPLWMYATPPRQNAVDVDQFRLCKAEGSVLAGEPALAHQSNALDDAAAHEAQRGA